MSHLLFLFPLFFFSFFSSTSSLDLSFSPLLNLTNSNHTSFIDENTSRIISRPLCSTYNNNCLACISPHLDINCGYCQSHVCEEKYHATREMCGGEPAKTCPNYNHTSIVNPVQGFIPLIGNWNGMIHSSYDWFPALSVIPIDNYAFVMGMNDSLDQHTYLVGKSGIAYQLIQAATTWDMLLLQRDPMPLPTLVPNWYEPEGVEPPIPSSTAVEITIPTPYIDLTSTFQLGLLFTVSSNLPSTTHTFNINFSFHSVNLSVATVTASDWTLSYPTSTSSCIRCNYDILIHNNTSRGWAAIQGSNRDTLTSTTLYMSEVIITYSDIINAAGDANIPLKKAILTGIIITQPTPSNKRATSQLMIYATSNAVYCEATDHMKVTPITSSTPSFTQQLDSDYIPWGTHVNITCDLGYLPTGSNHRTIQAVCTNTTFINKQQQEITCQQVICKTIPTPSHSTLSTVARIWGTTVTITCDEGYLIAGGQGERNVTYTCGYQGWNQTGPVPKCERSCLPPRPPRNGHTSITSSSFPTGTNISITCDSGYTLLITNTICTSINDGISDWRPIIPTSCSRICTFNISHLMASRHLIVEQDLVTFTCHQGYVLMGTASATCLSTGNWSNSLPTCQLLQTTSTPTTPSLNDTAGLSTNEVSSIASSTVAGMTVLPIIALILMTVLLLFPRFTPIPGVRMEPGHRTCCLILSSPHAHWIARSKIIHVMPILILILQIISIPLILGFNALSSVDGDELRMVGLPSCTHLIASTDCNSTRAGSYLVFIYLIFALITCLITALIIIQSTRQHTHTHTPSSYRWTVTTQLLLLIALLTWFVGPYRTYSHLFSDVQLTWTCCLLIACISLGWLQVPLLHLHIQHAKFETSIDQSSKHIEMQTTNKVESTPNTPGAIASTAQHSPCETDGISPTIASATTTGTATATSAFESQTWQSPLDPPDPHHPIIHTEDNTTAIEQQPVVVLQMESPRQLTIHQGEE